MTVEAGRAVVHGRKIDLRMSTLPTAAGEAVREPAEIKLDLPLDASLPKAYVPKEELRLEAYRRCGYRFYLQRSLGLPDVEGGSRSPEAGWRTARRR